MIPAILRRVILGKRQGFRFTRYQQDKIDFHRVEDGIGLYIHIPFCKSLCPYCPYNKVLYNKEQSMAYKEALIGELKLYQKKIGNKEISSIYIGGGTPTVFTQELGEVLGYIRENYIFRGDVGIEVHPREVSHELMGSLSALGVNLISLGVQTFKEEHLKFLGRSYNEALVDQAVEIIKQYSFDCLDIDIMTNIPGQTLEDIQYDVKKAYAYDIDQLSIYPLIVFPMTPLYKAIREKKLTRFSEIEERKILQIIDEVSNAAGYGRNTVWTYGKMDKKNYTSVTRESFIGLGAGATSLFDQYFYLNTFDVEAYIKSIEQERLPINLVNEMADREKMIFWLFWRCYEGEIDKERFRQLFQVEMEKEFSWLFRLLKWTGMAQLRESRWILTEWGSYVYHLIEKRYSIHYLNHMWESCMAQPWIEELYL